MIVPLAESQVTRQCIDMLLAEGWECRRQHVGTFVPVSKAKDYKPSDVVSIGTAGDPDWLIIRAERCEAPTVNVVGFYLEFKRTKGGKLGGPQRLRHNLLRTLGFEVYVCRGLDELREWLGRRKLLSEDRALHFKYSADPLEAA